MSDFDDAQPLNPFALQAKPAASGAVSAMEKREETEVFAMVMMAKRFPREQAASMDRILIAFQRPSLAEVAQYQFARGGTDIVGPSIRAAEAIAQEWGNIDTGWRELSRGRGADGKPYSEVMAYAIDLQSTTRKALQFIVPHWRDTRSGGYQLKDERDIYELCANQAQRRLRACILALIPGDVVEQAMNQAGATLRTKADTSPEAMKKMVAAFEPWGITQENIEARIQRKLDAISPAQVVGLKRIYASLRDDMSRPHDWFPEIPEPEKKPATTTLADLAAKGKPEPAATPAPAPATDLAGTPLGTGGPTPKPAEELEKKLKTAKTIDALETWAAGISKDAYPDEAVRMRLGEVYEARRAELTK